jgi:hypothetical protein
MVRRYKDYKRGRVRFTQLEEWFQASAAWASLKPGPRALYVELKRRYNGYNNGRIYLSNREAAKALNIDKGTAGSYFAKLRELGFIAVTKGHHLGPDGVGQSDHYRLTEIVCDIKPATKDFMKWKPVEK